MSDFNRDMFDKIIATQEKISENITEIKTTQVVQQEILREHTRRSELNEQAIDILKTEIKPLQTSKAQVDGALKLIALFGIISTIISVVLKVFRVF